MTVSLGEIPISPPVVLAPMAGITDRPFRGIVRRFGAGLVVSEMVATGEMLTGRASTRAKAEIGAGEADTAVQLAGREAAPMAEAARMVAGEGARIVDINMGCPAKKVTTGASGAALMRDVGHALDLIEAVVGAVSVPVTLKMRLGWDDTERTAVEIARRAEAAGVAMITIHGRTRAQFYRGRADWDAIGEVVGAVGIPVLANGDILDGPSATAALGRSGAAGVMVGRGARGRPWVLAEIAAHLAGKLPPPRPRGPALAALVAEHAEAHVAFYGAEIGLRSFRKHIDGYCAALPGSKPVRDRLMRAETPAELLRIIARDLPGEQLSTEERQAA
ncbi:MAG: tRNA dihydrouridine synthase DusB [Paracoccaceae bacterium]